MAQTLSAAQVKDLNTVGKHRVDHNLYLQVTPRGTKSWLYRFHINGRTRVMGLGSTRLIPLATAREKAIKMARQRLDGEDPIDARRQKRTANKHQVTVPTFKACAIDLIKSKKDGWSNKKHEDQWVKTLETYAYPTLGAMAVNQITATEVAKVLSTIWTTKHETASRVRQRIQAVLDFAAAAGHRDGVNPALLKGPLQHMLPKLSKDQKVVQHHQAIPHADVPALVADVRAREGTSAPALLFTLLTAARSGEVRGMRWREVNTAAAVWTVPGDRMKAGKEHRVPLTAAAMAVLPKRGAPDDLVFPGAVKLVNGVAKTAPLSDMSLLKVMRVLRGAGSTVHGLRSTFRDWAADQTHASREVVEACLAHAIGNASELAYKRTDFFEKRRDLMCAWATFCTTP